MDSKRPEKALRPLVEMTCITKRFPAVLANHHVNFTCAPGEIHALLGENGAGKSTLMKILAGLYRPDSGEIRVHGEPVVISSPREALRLGIGMVHQELRLVKGISVAENIVMGSKDLDFFYSRTEQESRVQKFSLTIGLEVDPRTPVWQLSVGEQQRVEILKTLYRGVRMLVLDEPTALLTPQETSRLFEYLRRIVSIGRGIAFVTHKLEEVMDVADRITVLRQGEAIATLKKQETNVQDLARLMIGRIPESESSRSEAPAGDVILEVKNIGAMGDGKRAALNGVSFSLSRGEILGVAGVAGNGQRELAEALVGLRTVSEGDIFFDGDPITRLSPRQILSRGIGYIPEDRLGVGVVPVLPLSENFILKDYRSRAFSGRFFLKPKWVEQNALELIEAYNIKTPDIHTPVGMLSGGNIQKVILAREISRNPKLLVAMNPTRGLDVGATEAIHHMFLDQKSAGTAILLISEDLDELFKLSDRITVIYKGAIKGLVKADRSLVNEIGLLMGGASG